MNVIPRLISRRKYIQPLKDITKAQIYGMQRKDIYGGIMQENQGERKGIMSKLIM